ncbi:MAG: pilus assembly PilX family protein [Pseudomonadota bacterium]
MKRQQGAALIVVLSLLTISLMVGLSSMQSSQIDERLAGNYKAASQAQMGAEEAASMGWDNIKGVDDDDWISLSDLTGSGLEGLTWEEIKNGEDGGCESPVSCYYRYVEDGEKKYIVGVGAVDDGGVSESQPVFIVLKEKKGGGWGDAGMLAGGDINVNGASTVNGRVHANGDINANFLQVNLELGGLDDSGMTEGFEKDLPVIDFSIYDDVVELPRQEGKGKNKGSYYCDFDFSGDLGGEVYYCNGDVKIGSGFSNATILSSGDVDNNGAISIGEFFGDVDTEIIAKGDVSFSGASAVWGGWFLAGGDINQNGASSFYGSMIAHGDINRNGAMVFVNKKGGGGAYESSEGLSIASWE